LITADGLGGDVESMRVGPQRRPGSERAAPGRTR
jgi:hypothetical protein